MDIGPGLYRACNGCIRLVQLARVSCRNSIALPGPGVPGLYRAFVVRVYDTCIQSWLVYPYRPGLMIGCIHRVYDHVIPGYDHTGRACVHGIGSGYIGMC